MKQTDEAKLERSREILEALKEARGGKLLDSHRVMGNDPNLINMFYQQYVNCNKKDISIPKKYRELIVMAVGIATSTETTMKVHGKLALENGATIDGIVIASTSEDFKTIKRQIPDKFPMIFMDRVLPDRNYDSVILDCQEATAKMLEEMIQNGFRKIGFLVGLPQISPTYERVKVYQQILKQYEIPETEQYVRYIDRKKDTYDVAGELVEAGCTAIIATNTAMTHSVLNYVEDRNLKLGEEIAVGGFVDSDFANRFMHRIPVVYEPMKEMGKLAGEMIVEKIEDKNRKIPVKTLTCEYDSNDFYKK